MSSHGETGIDPNDTDPNRFLNVVSGCRESPGQMSLLHSIYANLA